MTLYTRVCKIAGPRRYCISATVLGMCGIFIVDRASALRSSGSLRMHEFVRMCAPSPRHMLLPIQTVHPEMDCHQLPPTQRYVSKSGYDIM